jgi:hypothetical protein
MGKQVEPAEHQEMAARLKEVRAAAIKAARRAIQKMIAVGAERRGK